MKSIFKILLITAVALIIIMLAKTFMLTTEPVNRPDPIDININTDLVKNRLSKMVQFVTVSNQDPSKFDAKAFDEMHAYLEQTFPLVYEKLQHEVVNGHSLLFKWQGKNAELKPILLLAHQDVVPIPPEALSDWTHPPFSGLIDETFIWGRGTLDDKASLTGILEATTFLLKENFEPERTIYLAFGHDEEVGGVEGAAKIAALLKSRNIQLEYVLDEGGVISDGLIPGVDRRVAMIGIAEKGFTSLQLKVNAAGGHSSIPPKHTAIGTLSQAIVDLEANPFPANVKYSLKFFKTLAPYMSFSTKMVLANTWISKSLLESQLSKSATTSAMIRTTTAATMIKGGVKDNVLPPEADAIVNFRILPGDTADYVLAHVKEIINNPKIKVTPTRVGRNPSKVSPTDSDSFRQIATTIHQANGEGKDLIVAPYLVMGGTDARNFEDLTPNIYRFLFNETTPDDIKRYHNTNERISIENYVKVIRFYYQLMKNSNTLGQHR